MRGLTVSREQRVEAPVERTWTFLTTAPLLTEWFADATPVAPGEPFRFDFGDGDFFTGQVRHWDAPQHLGLVWRFMDVGPVFRINFDLRSDRGGTIVRVSDTGAETPEDAEGLSAGWEDFLARLARRVSTGQTARYRWSPCIGASAIVPLRPAECFALLANHGWWRHAFPSARLSLEPGPSSLRAIVADSSWLERTTRAEVTLRDIDRGTAVSVVHDGWDEFPVATQIEERRRYAARWAAALKELEAVAGHHSRPAAEATR